MPKCYTIDELPKLETIPSEIAIKASLLNPTKLQKLIAFLTQHPINVVAIDFSQNEYAFSPATLKNLIYTLKKCINIVELNFDNSNIHHISQCLGEVLTCLPRLQKLSFKNTQLTVAFVTRLKHCLALTHLNLDNALNRDLDILNALAALSQITCLSLACNSLGSNSEIPWKVDNHSKVLELLAQILELPNLKYLYLSANNLSIHDVLNVFTKITHLLQLRELNLKDNNLPLEFLKEFILHIWNKAKSIHTLNLQNRRALVTPTINQMNLLHCLIQILAQHTQVLNLTLPLPRAIPNFSILASTLVQLRRDYERMRHGIMCVNRANISLPPEIWQIIAGFINKKMLPMQPIPHSILQNIQHNLEDSDHNHYLEDSDQEEDNWAHMLPRSHEAQRGGHF